MCDDHPSCSQECRLLACGRKTSDIIVLVERLRGLKTPLLIGAITVGLLLVIELISLFINMSVGYTEPYFLRLGSGVGEEGGPRAELEYPHLDPHLGWAPAPGQVGVAGAKNYGGFFVLGDGMRAEALRIVALGGSTTEGGHEGYHGNWPLPLRDLIEAGGQEATIYNGGVGGYSSSQELMKLVRDVMELRPHLVISYSGTNEVQWTPTGHPMVSRHHAYLMGELTNLDGTLLMPNTLVVLRRLFNMHAVAGVEYGVATNISRAALWARNMKMMKAICDGFGVRFLAVLQPTSRYKEGFMGEFYTEAIPLADDTEYIANLVEALGGRDELYQDEVHLTKDGNEVIAKALYKELRGRGLLTKAAE